MWQISEQWDMNHLEVGDQNSISDGKIPDWTVATVTMLQ